MPRAGDKSKERVKPSDKVIADEEPVKVDRWNGAAVKHALDDAAKNVFVKQLKFVEDFYITDYKLLLCTIACCFSLFALGYDYVAPFPKSIYVLASCVVSYFIIMAYMTWYGSKIEGDCFMTALDKDLAGIRADDVWKLHSTLPRYSHLYTLTIRYKDGASNTTKEAGLKKCISSWFDDEGSLVMTKYWQDVLELYNDIRSKKE
ncbi:signal peptidase complex subunit 2-like [Dysidea avara]|uniref:signal peptidase complex subunit 2-like n=1 Tax=Dysidea avara TaxID=196820 RepID=UPI0033262CD6